MLLYLNHIACTKISSASSWVHFMQRFEIVFNHQTKKSSICCGKGSVKVVQFKKVQDCIPGRQCGTRQTTVVSLIAYLSPHLSKGFHALLQFLFHLRKFGILRQLLLGELVLFLHRQTFLLLQL